MNSRLLTLLRRRGGVLPLSFDFTGANDTTLESLGFTAGSHWTIQSNAANAAPTAGAELWDAAAAVFTSGTYAWTAFGGNSVSNVANELVIAYVDTSNGAREILTDAADLSANPAVGTFYRLGIDVRINSGAFNLFIESGDADSLINDLSNTSAESLVIGFLCKSATGSAIQVLSMNAGEEVTIDNLSLKPFTTSDILATVDGGETNVQVKADWTVTNFNIGGVCACLDDATNPTQGVFAWTNGSQVYLAKLISGTFTVPIRAGAYSTGANVEIRRNGDTVQLYYDDAQVGTDQTISDLGSGTIHGLIGTGGDAGTFNVTQFP